MADNDYPTCTDCGTNLYVGGAPGDQHDYKCHNCDSTWDERWPPDG